MTGFHREGAGWVVVCEPHDFRCHVETEGHALNLMRKHDREYAHAGDEPRAIDLSAAADYVLVCKADSDDDTENAHAAAAYFAALDLWQALTGLPGPEALAYAETIRETGTKAAPIPF